MSSKRNLMSLLISVALASGTFHAATASADTGSTGYNLGQVESGTRDASALRQGAGPIVYSTGNLIAPETDFSGKGEMALFLTRTFNNYWGGVGIFGAKWQSNFDYKLSFNSSSASGACYPRPGAVCATPPTGTTGLTLWAHLPDGRRIQYIYNAAQNKWFENKPSPISYIVRNSSDGSYTLYNDHQGVERYSASGYVMSIADAQNVGWTFAYDASNYLKTVTHTNGRKVTFTWTGNQLTKVTGPGGNAHTYSYSALGGLNLLNKVTGISDVGMTTYTYYGYADGRFPGSLTSISRDNESLASYAYDANGYASTMTLGQDGVHSVFTFAYTPGANNTMKVVETSSLGRQTTYNFANGLVTSTSGTGGAGDTEGSNLPDASKTHTYDANGYDQQVTDFKGNTTVYTYAANGQLQKMVEASGQPEQRTTQYTWDPTPGTNRLTRVVVVGDHQIDYTYDLVTQRVATVSQTNLTSAGVANQVHSTTYTYTNNATTGILQKMIVNGPVAGNSDMVTYTYSGGTGDLLSVKNNLGQTTTYGTYNALGEPGQMTGPNGETTVYTYNGWGQTKDVQTSPNGVAAHTTYGYTASGQLSSVTTPDGVVEHYVYDDTRHLIAKYRAANGTVVGGSDLEEEDYVYNAADEVIEVDETAKTGHWGEVCTHWWVDGEGVRECSAYAYQFTGTSTTTSKATRAYDGLGRLWRVTGSNGQKFTNGYDLNGNLISTIDSLNHLTTYSFDHLNRKIGTVDAKNGITMIGYDAGNRVASVVDPRFLVTSYVYDGFGQLWAQSSPDTGTVSFTYDAAGRKTGYTRADGIATTYTFDGLNRVATAQAGGKTQTFTYDSCTNGIGRLCGVADALNGANDSLTTTYTPEGWVASQHDNIGGTVYNTSYAYDNMGRVTDLTYPNGVVAHYAFAGGKLASSTVTIGGTTSNLATAMTYQPYAGIAHWTYGNGLLRTQNYDMDGRLTGISTKDGSSTVVQSLTLGYDADNAVTGITNGAFPSLTQGFGYDELLRLTGQSTPSHDTTWGYDADSNRNGQVAAAGSTTYNLSSTSNELASLTGAGARTFGYDLDGNRTSDSNAPGSGGAVTFHYDPFNRMDSSTKGGVTTNYHVDPQGRRVYKATGTNWTHFLYAPEGSLLSENNATAGATDYLWMGGTIVGMVRNNTLYSVHTDQVGRPEMVTNAAKAVVWRANNYAFDRTVALDSIGGLNIGFPGQYYDAETGLWNNGFRDYDPSTGRYVESDPLGLDAGINTFAYVGGNPLTHADALGLKWSEVPWVKTFVIGPWSGIQAGTAGFVVGVLLGETGPGAVLGGIATTEISKPIFEARDSFEIDQWEKLYNWEESLFTAPTQHQSDNPGWCHPCIDNRKFYGEDGPLQPSNQPSGDSTSQDDSSGDDTGGDDSGDDDNSNDGSANDGTITVGDVISNPGAQDIYVDGSISGMIANMDLSLGPDQSDAEWEQEVEEFIKKTESITGKMR